MPGYPVDGVIPAGGPDRRVSRVTLLANSAPWEFDQHGGVLEQGLLRTGLSSGFGDALTLVLKVNFVRTDVRLPRQGSRPCVQRDDDVGRVPGAFRGAKVHLRTSVDRNCV